MRARNPGHSNGAAMGVTEQPKVNIHDLYNVWVPAPEGQASRRARARPPTAEPNLGDPRSGPGRVVP